jgi:hypothetical protein
MPQTREDVIAYVEDQGIRFIRLWFTDILGRLKSFSINALELDLTVPARIYDAHRNGIPLQELRVIATDTGASGGSLTVPTTVASQIYAYMTASVAMRRMGCTIITTASGNAMNFPRVSTHGIATQVASQTTAFAGTDPILSMMTLNAYDYGQLTAISNECSRTPARRSACHPSIGLARSLPPRMSPAPVLSRASKVRSPSSNNRGVAACLVPGRPGAGEADRPPVLGRRQLPPAPSTAWLMRDLTGARSARSVTVRAKMPVVCAGSCPRRSVIGGQPDTSSATCSRTNVAESGVQRQDRLLRA